MGMSNFQFLWVLVMELAAGIAFAQSSPQGGSAPAQATDPKIKVETRVVLVDVAVTDAKGDPILNLKRGDFRITENATPQSISSFEEHKLDHSKLLVLPVMPPNVYTNFPSAKLPDAV